MKPINPRSGHGPAFGPEILYFLAAAIMGWPVTFPFLFVSVQFSEALGIPKSGPAFDIQFAIAVIAGVYAHYKLWAWLYSVAKAWWTK